MTFKTAVAEALPFPEAQFDVVVNTLMLHHLPRTVRQECAREIRACSSHRAVCLSSTSHRHNKSGILARFRRHGHVQPRDVVAFSRRSGLAVSGRTRGHQQPPLRARGSLVSPIAGT